MRRIWKNFVGYVLLVASCAGCADNATGPVVTPEITVIYANQDISVDGQLTESVWQKAPVYRLLVPGAQGSQTLESGKVCLAWNERYLFLAVRFVDSDILATGQEDQLPHFSLGDVAEFFLWPQDQTWYWEVFATPLGKKSFFFFAGGGSLKSLGDCQEIKVTARMEGTVNNWHDRDCSWSAEVAIPWTTLTADGKPSPRGPWRFLAGRYNWSRYLPRTELSSFPLLPKVDFHDRGNYARLRFQNSDGKEVQIPR